MHKILFAIIGIFFLFSCTSEPEIILIDMKKLFFSAIATVILACTPQPSQNETLLNQIQTNEYFAFVKGKALEIKRIRCQRVFYFSG